MFDPVGFWCRLMLLKLTVVSFQAEDPVTFSLHLKDIAVTACSTNSYQPLLSVVPSSHFPLPCKRLLHSTFGAKVLFNLPSEEARTANNVHLEIESLDPFLNPSPG